MSGKNSDFLQEGIMNRKTGYLLTASLFLTAYASTGVVQADTVSMQALAEDALGKSRECSQVSSLNRNAGQYNNTLVDKCSLACSRAHSLLAERHKYPPSQEQQLAQVGRCKQAYNNYKSPETASVEEEISMPTTVEEMVSRMPAMKREGKRDSCVKGVKLIQRKQLGLEQAKYHWNRCVRQYKQDMKMRRANGG